MAYKEVLMKQISVSSLLYPVKHHVITYKFLIDRVELKGGLVCVLFSSEKELCHN